MKLVIGLGNPGQQYGNTRHNIGFLIVEKFILKYGVSLSKESKFNSFLGKGNILGESIIFLEPLTYMNLSGEAVSKVMNWYKIDIDDIVVIFDDISLDFGRVRFRKSGSDGGHNGIKSIIQHLGGNNKFARLKVGIGPDPGATIRRHYVLQNFSKQETEELPKLIKVCEDGLETFFTKGISEACNQFNGVNILEGEEN